MKTYTMETGSGEGRSLDLIVFSITYLANDLIEAVSKAKELIRSRGVDPRETMVLLSEIETSLIWTPSVEFLRDNRSRPIK